MKQWTEEKHSQTAKNFKLANAGEYPIGRWIVAKCLHGNSYCRTIQVLLNVLTVARGPSILDRLVANSMDLGLRSLCSTCWTIVN